MKATSIQVVIFHLPFIACAINFKNNACPILPLYRIAPFGHISGCYINPDVSSDVPRMVKRNGYNFKSHLVTTDDNYILTIFEVSEKVTKKLSIFIQHGISTNSGPWVDIGNRSIAFYFADRGYRVFLGNARGTTYSIKHKNLSIEDPEYWRFTLDTVAEKDLDAQLNFVFKKVGAKIHYIGHSMGTTLALMFFSTSTKKANQWIQSVSLLAPVAYLDGVPAVELVKRPAALGENLLSALKLSVLFYHETELHNVIISVCKRVPELCREIINIIFGRTRNLRSEDLLLVFGYYPIRTSIYQFKHYLQIAESKRFQKYDYGSENQQVYGTETPPVYNLTNLKLPICFFYGEHDSLYTKQNLERAFSETGSTNKCKHSIASEKGPYNHLDFLYGEYIASDLYELLLEFINQNESK